MYKAGRLIAASLIATALAASTMASPVYARSGRVVDVINHTNNATAATLYQHGPVGSAEIAPRYTHSFRIPSGYTSIQIKNVDCTTGANLTLPTVPHIRVVIDGRCHLSAQ